MPSLQKAASQEPNALLSLSQIAELLSCSTRHVQRLADAGKMPKPVRLGVLLRWPRQTINDWIADGCPAVRTPQRAGR